MSVFLAFLIVGNGLSLLISKINWWKNLPFVFLLFFYWVSFFSISLLLYKHECISIIFRILSPEDVSIWEGDVGDRYRTMCCPTHSFPALLVLENYSKIGPLCCFLSLKIFYLFVCITYLLKNNMLLWTYYLTLQLCILPWVSVIKIGISIIY